jgi:hypothetical protein
MRHASFVSIISLHWWEQSETLKLCRWRMLERINSSVARWPEFRPKSSKEAGGKKVGRKNLWPNFGRILPTVKEKPRKGAEENFLKKFHVFR